jgi:hypothetical protein
MTYGLMVFLVRVIQTSVTHLPPSWFRSTRSCPSSMACGWRLKVQMLVPGGYTSSAFILSARMIFA